MANAQQKLRFILMVITSVTLVLYISNPMQKKTAFFYPSILLGYQDKEEENSEDVLEKPSDTGSRLISRNVIMRENCHHLGLDHRKITASKDRFIHNSNYDLYVCLVAKSGASTWRQLIKNLEKIKRTKGEKIKGDIMKIMASNTPTKVLTVRNPLTRLISAFRDKFGDGKMSNTGWTQRLWYASAEKHLATSLGDQFNKSISFEQFLEFGIKHVKNDRHFRPVHLCCSPCVFHYDYILHLETFDDDVAFVFDALNISMSRDVHKNLKSTGIPSDPIQHYFGNLSRATLEMVYNFVKTDFLILGYQMPEFFKEFL